MAFKFEGTQANDIATAHGSEDYNDDINNPNVNADDEYDAASALNETRDSGAPRTPIPDSWKNENGVYVPLLYTGLFEFADTDPDKQVQQYGDGKRVFRTFNFKGKVTGCDNPAVPRDLWERKSLTFLSISTLLMQNEASALHFAKAALGKHVAEKMVNDARRELDSTIQKNEELRRAVAWQDMFEDIVRKALQSGEPVRFRCYWDAQYKSTSINAKTGKPEYKSACKFMKNFPEDEREAVGHYPAVVAPGDAESPDDVPARLSIDGMRGWLPKLDR